MMRIGIVGSESTGKSTLCRQLSERCGYRWEQEYARTYVEALSRPYTIDDLDAIAEHLIGQISNTGNEEVVLYDTELIVMKVWYEHVYGRVPKELEQAIKDYPMDCYLLLAPDLPAIPDPVRENLDRREYFFEWYEREIQATGTPYTVISGIGEQRLHAATDAINRYREAYI